MTREKIENFREVILPFNRRVLLKIDYEGHGASDAEEFAKDFNEILNLAIKALEQESTTKNDLAVDAVSRKAVINQIFYSIDNSGDVVLGSALRERIARLPSVTPQEPQSFKWCTDCREYDQEKHCCHRHSKVIRDTVEEMKQEPRKGHWISRPHIYGVAFCSECGFELKINNTNYCPNCGCCMIEPQESEKT